MTKRKQYTQEFKLDAVNLVIEQGYSRAAQEATLAELNGISHLHEKGYRNRPLGDA